MKVLIVHSGNKNSASPYIMEQVNSLRLLGIQIEHFTLQKPGFIGYISHLPQYYKKIRKYKPDIVHAHFGLSGLFANLQRKIPVITTFHGTDVHKKKNRLFSKLAYFLSKECIFVSNNLRDAFEAKGGLILTCGVDITLFKPIPGIRKENFVLFGGRAGKAVKNYPLAKNALEYYNQHLATDHEQLELVELKEKTREEVVLLMNASQALLITSHYEGSSQVLKEAMACNCPVIAVNVGSVPDLISLESHAGIIVKREDKHIAEALQKIIKSNYNDGRKELEQHNISLKHVAQRLITIYKTVLINDN